MKTTSHGGKVMKLKILFLFLLSFACYYNSASAQSQIRYFNWKPNWNSNHTLGASASPWLNYFKKLGYTHCEFPVIYGIGGVSNIYPYTPTVFFNSSYIALFKKNSSGKWIYNNGNYTSGQIATDLRTMLNAIKSAGFTPIPWIQTLNHINIASLSFSIDNSVCDFAAPLSNTISATYNTLDPRTDPSGKRYFAANTQTVFYNQCIDIAQAGVEGDNLAMDQLFTEYCKILLFNWRQVYGGTSAPAYVQLNGEEATYYRVAKVNMPGSKSIQKHLTWGAAKLIAADFSTRITQIDRVFGTSTTKIFLGCDAYVPGDYNDAALDMGATPTGGKYPNLIGDPATGVGGALYILDKTYGRKSRVIAEPWIYINIDNQPGDPLWSFDNAGNPLMLDKSASIAFLNKLGYKYMFACGEFDTGTQAYIDDVKEQTKQCTFEWLKASQKYPTNCVGYGYLIFKENFNQIPLGGDGTYSPCWSASLLPYWGWQYGEQSLKLPRHNSYGSRMWKNCDYLKSRRDQAWTEGVHFFRPPLVSPLRNATFIASY
jgi:hypothetical protein